MPGRLSIHVPERPCLVKVLEGPAELCLGRSDDCDLVIEHHSVSRRHARLHCDDAGRCWIEDLGSKNGLRVNGARVQSAELDRALWFALGDVFCEYLPVQAEDVQRMAVRAQTLRDSSVELSNALDVTANVDVLLKDILVAMVHLAECRRGFVLLADPNESIHVIAVHALSPDELAGNDFSGSRSAIERALLERRPVYLSDASDGDYLRGKASVVGRGIRALACLPLLDRGRLLGAIYVDTDDSAKLFSELDASILVAFAERATMVMLAADIEARLAHVEKALGSGAPGRFAEQLVLAGSTARVRQ